MKVRMLKSLIDLKIVDLTNDLDKIIDVDYQWISKVCEENRIDPAEYFSYYADKLAEYLNPPVNKSNNNGQ